MLGGNPATDTSLPLFELLASRKSDPPTSGQAARQLIQSGKWRGQKRTVFEALRRNPGVTSAELAAIMCVDRYLTARRLPDLEGAGLVKKGRVRVCQATNSQCVTWWADPDVDGPVLYDGPEN